MKLTTRLAYKLLPPATWSDIRKDWALSVRRNRNSRRKTARLLKVESAKLHLGCGLRATPGWINIDAFDQAGVDVRWDLRDPLPMESGVAKLIYSEHVLEHFEFDEANALIREMFRVLSAGGRVRLGVPDAELYVQAYVHRDEAFFYGLKNIGNPVDSLDTPIKVINQMFRMGGHHRFVWDFETLSRQLRLAGFTCVGRWTSGQSSIPELCLDDPAHALETLYVEAEKPRA